MRQRVHASGRHHIDKHVASARSSTAVHILQFWSRMIPERTHVARQIHHKWCLLGGVEARRARLRAVNLNRRLRLVRHSQPGILLVAKLAERHARQQRARHSPHFCNQADLARIRLGVAK